MQHVVQLNHEKFYNRFTLSTLNDFFFTASNMISQHQKKEKTASWNIFNVGAIL